MKIRLIKEVSGCDVWKIEKLNKRLSMKDDEYWENYFYPSDISYLSYESALKDYNSIKNNKLYKGKEIIMEDEI